MKTKVNAAHRLLAENENAQPAWVNLITIQLKKCNAEGLKLLKGARLFSGDEDDEIDKASYKAVYSATSIDLYSGNSAISKSNALVTLHSTLHSYGLDINFQAKGGKVIITVSNDLETAL